MTPLSDQPAGDLHTALMGRVPHPEYLELTTATFLTAEQRVAITLIALGETHESAAAVMNTAPFAVLSVLSDASRHLDAASSLAADPDPTLVHAAYRHPGFPPPYPDHHPCPTLTSTERLVLLAHSGGFALDHMSQSRDIPLQRLTEADDQLLIKLKARNPAHAVRRGWQLGLFTRQEDQYAPPPQHR
ncbi:hypothetical protein [Streptomyces klenkii]|uniref:hypothetical protein n=1 Tax=Streptomyces klenkii TaxID=1420899 RepID=UPI00343AE2D0